MQQPEKYLKDLAEIKQMMQRSSRFVSLSGLSGVLAGAYALAGAVLAWQVLQKHNGWNNWQPVANGQQLFWPLAGIALGVVVLSAITAVYLTNRQQLKKGSAVWNRQARQLVVNLLVPLVPGGLFALLLLYRGFVGLLAPVTLLFYGLALVNASKFTDTDIRTLGLMEIAMGLLAALWPGFGLLYWAGGFGLLHIVYGTLMHFKYRQ